jgi:hypothetical protein
MDMPDSAVEIQTLGRFRITVEGIPVATDWPDETLKVFFCSLLSPLDLYFTWDRVCRSMWDTPATRTSKRRLEEILIRPLNSFLIKELGFAPIIADPEGIRIDYQRLHVDAFEFYGSAREGFDLMTLGNHVAAFELFRRANALYVGRYLPEFSGTVFASARNALESLFQTVIKDAIPATQITAGSGPKNMTSFGQFLNTARKGLATEPETTPTFPDGCCYR